MPYTAITGAAPAPNILLGMPLTEVGDTLDSLRNKVVRMSGKRTDLDKIVLDQWINDAYVDVSTMFDFVETEFQLQLNLVQGQPFYALPPNIDYTTNALLQLPDTLSFRLGQRLDKIDLATYRNLPDLTGTGLQAHLESTRYFIHRNVLVVYPTPWTARILVLDGVLVPQPLSKDTDSPILSREWHRAIALKAKEMILTDNNAPQEALLAKNSFMSYVQSRTSRKAIEKTNRLASASMPRGDCGYNLENNSGNPFVDRGGN